MSTEQLNHNMATLTAMAHLKFDGLLNILYEDVIDAINLDINQLHAKSIAKRIGEPVLLTMGTIQQMFIPGNEKTRSLFGHTLDQGAW